jgi:hypothetical protein
MGCPLFALGDGRLAKALGTVLGRKPHSALCVIITAEDRSEVQQPQRWHCTAGSLPQLTALCAVQKSKSGSKAVNMALGGAGLSDEELQRLMLEHDAAQDNVILTESGLRHRDPRELGGDCGRYRWLQTDTEIVVEAPLPSGTLPSQIRVKVHTAYLAVHVKDDTIVSGKLSRVRTLPPSPLIHCPAVDGSNAGHR